MISRLIDESKIAELRKFLENNDRIVITCHMSPDGDALGASLGFASVLNSLGKNATVIVPDTPPKNLMFLPGAKDIVVYSRYEEFARQLIDNAELLFALDYNDPKRTDRLADSITSAKAPKVMIDHHLFPTDFCNVTISYPEVSSTSMLVFRVLCRLELFTAIDKEAATCLYTGMMTDTGNFSYNSNDPDLYIVISELLKKGIDKDAIYKRVYNSVSMSSLQLNAYAIDRKMEVIADGRCAIISLSRDELNSYSYKKGDTEGLVNRPLSVPEVLCSFFLREEESGIRVSSRSKGDFPVNKICEDHFGGGGHKNAAGGDFYGSIDEAIAKVKEVVPDYMPTTI